MSAEKTLDLGISVPEDMIKNLIAGAVAKSLGNSDSIVESIVTTAFEAKSRESYGSKTLFQEALEKMIRDRASAAMQEWLKQNETKLQSAFKKALDRSQTKLLAAFAENLEKGICTISINGVSIGLGVDR